MGSITTFLAIYLSTYLKRKIEKRKRSKKWMKLWRFFFQQMSGSQCDQLNDGVNKLTRRKPFLLRKLLCGNAFVYHRGHFFTFALWRLTSYFLILRTFYMILLGCFSFWAPTYFPDLIHPRHGPAWDVPCGYNFDKNWKNIFRFLKRPKTQLVYF